MKDSDFNEHEHEHDENCNCNSTISIPMEDGSDLVCDILGTFDFEEMSYIVLLPQGDEEIVIYKYSEESEEQITLTPIESDDELEKVVEAFYELYSDGDVEYDEEFEDEEDDDYDEDDFEDDEEDFEDDDDDDYEEDDFEDDEEDNYDDDFDDDIDDIDEK